MDTSRRCPRAPRNRYSVFLTAPHDSRRRGKIETRTPPPARLATSPRRLRRSCSHGTADTLVGYLNSEVLAQALTEAGVPVRLVPVEGADHIFNGHDDIDGVWYGSVDYLAEALLPARRTHVH